MSDFGNLIEVSNLRTVWPNEAKDFTPWLAQDDHIALLSNAIGIDITIDESESSVGDFNVDLYAHETDTKRRIIIENQLEDSNHDHLGKLLTYASGKDANIVIWLVKKARDEHKSAIEWLNNHTDDEIGFFLCEIKLYKIDNSKPAVKFEVVESPNDWAKAVRTENHSTAGGKIKYDFWVAFEDYAFAVPEFKKNFARRKPSTDHWMDFYIGSTDCHLAVTQIHKRNELNAELYISDDKSLFQRFFSQKEAIEKELNQKLNWREMPERKASRIMATQSDVDFKNQGSWPSLFQWLVETLIAMKKTFGKHI